MDLAVAWANQLNKPRITGKIQVGTGSEAQPINKWWKMGSVCLNNSKITDLSGKPEIWPSV